MSCFAHGQWTWTTRGKPAKPRTRVELHVHMDGAARLSTVWELSKLRGLPLPGDGSLEALKDAVVCTSPSTLCNFLDGFKWTSPVFVDDLEAIERLAYETCEDKANDGVLYMEMRYSPHVMLSGNGVVTARDVVASSLAGLRRGELEFSIKARIILCCMRNMPERANEVVELCDQFRDEGVVGIDVAGDEAADVDMRTGVEKFNPLIIEAFEEASRRGIRRTAHAGEAGPANGVETAMDRLNAERIGHGYHVVTDVAVYEKAKNLNVHFETCPYSSILSGAVPKDCPKHPIVRFAEEGVNFSISTDDPTITASTLTNEYQLLYDWGLTEAHVVRANVNALNAAFLPKEEINELSIRLKENINMHEL